MKKVFLHIPKTAGVSVREYIQLGLKPKNIHHVSDPNNPCLNKINAKDTHFVHGHFDASLLNDISEGYSLYTFLRSPIERIKSEYNFILNSEFNKDNLPKEQWVLLAKIRQLTLEEYALSQERGIRGRVQNAQLFYLSGDTFNPKLTLDERLISAKLLLERSSFVGIQEEFDMSVSLLCHQLGVMPPNKAIRRNTSSRTDELLSDSAIKEIKIRNNHDYLLYEYGLSLLKQRFIAEFSSITKQRVIQKLANQKSLKKINYTFDQALIGEGWHTRENNGPIYWRFTGPTLSASLYFPSLKPADYTLKLSVFHTVSPEHLTTLVIKVNGNVLKLKSTQNNVLFYEFTLRALKESPKYTKIEFETLECISPSDTDNRKLGVAFSGVEIY